MKIAFLKLNRGLELLTTAATMCMRLKQMACFAVAMDASKPDGDTNVLAHCVVLSSEQAAQLEPQLRAMGMRIIDVIRSDFDET